MNYQNHFLQLNQILKLQYLNSSLLGIKMHTDCPMFDIPVLQMNLLLVCSGTPALKRDSKQQQTLHRKTSTTWMNYRKTFRFPRSEESCGLKEHKKLVLFMYTSKEKVSFLKCHMLTTMVSFKELQIDGQCFNNGMNCSPGKKLMDLNRYLMPTFTQVKQFDPL